MMKLVLSSEKEETNKSETTNKKLDELDKLEIELE